MDIELRELSLTDGMDIFEMIREIGLNENGFNNGGYNMEYNDFPSYLQKKVNVSKGINLHPNQVPQTIYWLYVGGKLVGMGKLHDYLNDDLRKSGGHIGYAIRLSERGKGYGNLILREILKKSKEKCILEALLTCSEDNTPSRKVIEANGGQLEDITEQSKCRYWIRNF